MHYGTAVPDGKVSRITTSSKQRYVRMEWIIDSVRAGRRLPEAGYETFTRGGDRGMRRISETWKARPSAPPGLPPPSPAADKPPPASEQQPPTMMVDMVRHLAKEPQAEIKGSEAAPSITSHSLNPAAGVASGSGPGSGFGSGSGSGSGSAPPAAVARRTAMSTRENPDFVHQYYQQSRLSFLSNFKLYLKREIPRLIEERRADPAYRPHPSVARCAGGGGTTAILHFDMDCFFVSVARARNRALRNVPVVVAHGADVA
jgi:hypothetical protein